MSLSDKIVDKEKWKLYEDLFGCGCCAKGSRPDKVILAEDVKEALRELKDFIRKAPNYRSLNSEEWTEVNPLLIKIDEIFGEKLI